MSGTLVMVATYNEADNVEATAQQILELGLELDILFVDDNSPDGTGDIIDALAARDPRVHALHRPGKLGIGSAHSDGIRWAYRHDFAVLVTMDCDRTHTPADIPDFLSRLEAADVVVGSRYLNKDSLSDWNIYRWLLTQTGHQLTTRLLDMPYDATGAFRAYRLASIPAAIFELVRSPGYSFFFESLYLLHVNGFRVAEFPIRLPARTYGESKMRFRDALDSLLTLGYVFVSGKLEPERFRLGRSDVQITGEPIAEELTADWDSYWTKRSTSAGVAFDIVAAFYRKFIIRPNLNRALRETFPQGGAVLHAGCGSGQVDQDVARILHVTALDISTAALQRYARNNEPQGPLVRASVFDVPLEDGSFDGIYNLGVMEHFSEDEILRSLAEFRRLLKPDGRLVLFWPPEFGLSVTFLKGVHFVLKHFFDQPAKLHPDEINRIRSKRHVEDLLHRAGFELERYLFGPRDLFTYVIVVARPGARTASSARSG